jgi:Uma2 family endonuclease
MRAAGTTTAEELFKLQDDGYRHELVRGDLRKMTPSGFEHGAVVVNLTVPLGQHVKAHRLGVVCGAETGFVLARNPDTVLAPDVAFVRQDRLGATGRPTAFWPGAPDLAIEVLSPSDTTSAVEEKVTAWLSSGAMAVWVVDPKRRTATVHQAGSRPRTFAEDETLDGDPIVPGFRLPVREIFAV